MTEPLEHLIFAHAFTEVPPPCGALYANSREEGKYIVQRLDADFPMRNHSLVKPQLLVLFATLGSLDRKRHLEEFLEGIWEELRFGEHRRRWRGVSLIGCSVAACVSNEKLHSGGAVLLAICSVTPFRQGAFNSPPQIENPDLLGVRVLAAACGNNAAEEPVTAVNQLYSELKLKCPNFELNPHENRFGFLFTPGYQKVEGADPKYEDSGVVRSFCEVTKYRIPLFGGSGAQQVGLRDVGFQFLNEKVLRNSVVAAVVECNVQLGIAMNSSFKSMSPQQFIQIEADNEGTRRVRYNGSSTIKELVEERRRSGKMLFLGTRNEEGDPTIYIPKLDKEEPGWLKFWRNVDPHKDLEILDAGNDEVFETVQTMLQTAQTRGGFLESGGSGASYSEVYAGNLRVAGALGCFCAGRLAQTGVDPIEWSPVFNLVASRIDGNPFIAGFVNGECGLDRTGRSIHNNLQISGLVLGTQLTMEAQLRWGYQALAKVSKMMMEATSVKGAVSAALDGVLDAGFRGGMLSLLCPEGKDLLNPASVVAQDARGGCWPNIIHLTKRLLNVEDPDVLAHAIEVGHSLYVPDAGMPNSRCEVRSRDIVGVRSMFIGLLKDAKHDPLGILQIDLGDRSTEPDLPERLREFLDAYVNVVASALQRAISSEQERADREITNAFYRAFDHRDSSKAANEVISAVLRLLGLEMGYIRLRPNNGTSLIWTAGKGCYSDAISNPESSRHQVLPAETASSSAASFSDASTASSVSGSYEVYGIIGNDISNCAPALKLREELNQEPERNAAEIAGLNQVQSFVNLAFSSDTKGPLGVLNVDSREPWFFTKYRVDIIKNAASRVGLCLKASRTQEELDSLRKLHGFASGKIAASAPSADYAELPRVIIDGAKQLCPDHTTIELWTYHHRDQELHYLQGVDNEPRTRVLKVDHPDDLFTAIASRTAVWVPKSSLPRSLESKSSNAHTQGCLVIPLRTGVEVPEAYTGRLVGVLFCFCTETPKALVQDTLSHYGISVAHSMQHWQLHHMGRRLNLVPGFEGLQASIEEYAAELLGASHGLLWLYRPTRQSYILQLVWGYSRESFAIWPPSQSGRTERIRQSMQADYIEDWRGREDTPKPIEEANIMASFGIPLLGADFLGVAYFDFASPRTWSKFPEEKKFHSDFIGYLATAVARLSNMKALRSQQILGQYGLVALAQAHTVETQLDGLAMCAHLIKRIDVPLFERIKNHVERIRIIRRPLTQQDYVLKTFNVYEQIIDRWQSLREDNNLPELELKFLDDKSTPNAKTEVVTWPVFHFVEVLNNVMGNILRSIQSYLSENPNRQDPLNVRVEFSILSQTANGNILVFFCNSHPTLTDEDRASIEWEQPTRRDSTRWGWGFVVVGAILHSAGGSVNVDRPRGGKGTLITLSIPAYFDPAPDSM